MLERMANLQFLIGFFLLCVGFVVLGAHFFGGSDVVEGIAVNLVGGGTMVVVGIGMILGGLVPEEK
jgi:hypothetical protein